MSVAFSLSSIRALKSTRRAKRRETKNHIDVRLGGGEKSRHTSLHQYKPYSLPSTGVKGKVKFAMQLPDYSSIMIMPAARSTNVEMAERSRDESSVLNTLSTALRGIEQHFRLSAAVTDNEDVEMLFIGEPMDTDEPMDVDGPTEATREESRHDQRCHFVQEVPTIVSLAEPPREDQIAAPQSGPSSTAARPEPPALALNLGQTDGAGSPAEIAPFSLLHLPLSNEAPRLHLNVTSVSDAPQSFAPAPAPPESNAPSDNGDAADSIPAAPRLQATMLPDEDSIPSCVFQSVPKVPAHGFERPKRTEKRRMEDPYTRSARPPRKTDNELRPKEEPKLTRRSRKSAADFFDLYPTLTTDTPAPSESTTSHASQRAATVAKTVSSSETYNSAPTVAPSMGSLAGSALFQQSAMSTCASNASTSPVLPALSKTLLGGSALVIDLNDEDSDEESNDENELDGPIDRQDGDRHVWSQYTDVQGEAQQFLDAMGFFADGECKDPATASPADSGYHSGDLLDSDEFGALQRSSAPSPSCRPVCLDGIYTPPRSPCLNSELNDLALGFNSLGVGEVGKQQ